MITTLGVVLCAGSIVMVTLSRACAQVGLSVTPPADAPTSRCTVTPSADISSLRVIRGPAPLIEVLACGVREPGKCVADRFAPGSKELPSDTIAEFGHTERNWACVLLDGDAVWIPADRLAPLPATPAVRRQFWTGWWRRPHEAPGRANDQLLISPGASAGTMHISGRAFWYGPGDDVHFGQINTNASLRGRYLHAVDGHGAAACVLDLVADPAKRTITGFDNMNCGGMNVRFWGDWKRFTPSREHKFR